MSDGDAGAAPPGPALRLHNTLTRRKDPFVPIDPANVRLYACGPTVYDRAHIGNARPLIVFDVLFRLLRHLASAGAFDGGKGETVVTYARNVTDVDDKINARAAERGITIRELTDGTLADFREDAAALRCLGPEDAPGRMTEPRATDHIPEMVALIDRLVARGHAYVAADHVLFRVKSMSTYGSLSKRPPAALLAGARVEVAPYKENPLDFVLWKPSKPGEPAWPSPAGIEAPGRPGWHIECSAMSMKALLEPWGGGLACDDPAKNTFDIHAGGLDLIFPHHENEIAQSCCALGTGAMANYWLHNGFLQVEGRKMSKSEGNFVTIHQLLHTEDFGGRRWPGEVLRLAMLRTHYRQPIDWTVEALEREAKLLDRWYRMAAEVGPVSDAHPDATVLAALCDDLNTPQAISRLHGLFSYGGLGGFEFGASSFGWDFLHPPHAAVALASARVLGLMTVRPKEWLAANHEAEAIDPGQIDAILLARGEARRVRDWAESDRLRDQLSALGVALTDHKDGTTTWEPAR